MSAVQEIDDKVETVGRETPKPVPTPVEQPATTAAPPAAASEPTPVQPKKKSSKKRYAIMALVPLLLVGGGLYFWVTGGRFQETENANLRQARVTIASEIAGRITQVNLHENEAVKAGDVLFAVDPEPYRIALAQADAALAGARLNVEQLRASLGQAEAQQRSAQGEVAYLQQELERQTALSDKGVTTQSSLDTARRNLDKARDAELSAAQAVIGAKAALGGNPDIKTDEHPSVLSALAARDRAAYQLEQTTVTAPADGIVSQASSFKEGQFVSPGSALFTLVETHDAWVEANFKETQLTHMRRGQKAEIELDTFPGQPIEATVDSIGAGTGAEFSLLPAQNATGNWVKVTQRIPVRLKIDSADADLLLRTGMSATVNVDTGVARGWGSLFGHAYAGTPAAPETHAAN
ncbi:HlyD family secretion protein [Tianweitania sp. BSSL-BM11]|uniref:HlyD family secretion protein n=1 Tax=Tianweitania aestuarii TaxID=2814886 RepID=A0ABS5RVM7_9HYPH|nr:HlyD family secretion protein [Tianweitania aestuarii]MBS9721110.1 HlyD family secretion protein [Tianweitania aestuarii]